MNVINKTVVTTICNFINNNDNNSLRLSSKRFNKIISPLLFSNITININIIKNNKSSCRTFVNKYKSIINVTLSALKRRSFFSMISHQGRTVTIRIHLSTYKKCKKCQKWVFILCDEQIFRNMKYHYWQKIFHLVS